MESFLTTKKALELELKITVTDIFNCSLESAFKTPILCDVAKVHKGYGLMPRVTHCTEDTNWGKVGESKKVFVTKSLTQNGGFASVDRILERVENSYWKFQVDDFQSWMLGFNKFIGEWKVTELEPNKILIEYTYTLSAKSYLLYPLNYLFTYAFWKKYMKQVLKNVKGMAYNNEPFLFS